jgi:hypothetical protein
MSNLEQDQARDDAADRFRTLLGILDASFDELQQQVQALLDFRSEVIANVEGIYNADDVVLVDERLVPRRTAIQTWAAGLPGG